LAYPGCLALPFPSTAIFRAEAEQIHPTLIISQYRWNASDAMKASNSIMLECRTHNTLKLGGADHQRAAEGWRFMFGAKRLDRIGCFEQVSILR